MKDKVRLKGFPNGIRIAIDEDATMEEILPVIKDKFSDSGKLFKNARFAVRFEGRKNTEAEEDAIIRTMEETGNVSVVCVLSEDGDEPYENAVRTALRHADGETAQFYRGNLTGKKRLETEQNIIVLGNVEKGCQIISSKNIIVLGTLSGAAYAGVDGKPHFIAALAMEPELIRIGERKGKYKRKRGFGKKKPSAAQIAYVREEEIVFEDLMITEELLQNLE
jgi:septum site-determining protein MinC